MKVHKTGRWLARRRPHQICLSDSESPLLKIQVRSGVTISKRVMLGGHAWRDECALVYGCNATTDKGRSKQIQSIGKISRESTECSSTQLKGDLELGYGRNINVALAFALFGVFEINKIGLHEHKKTPLPGRVPFSSCGTKHTCKLHKRALDSAR